MSSAADVHHPVDRALLCSTHLLQNKHFIFPGLNVHAEPLCDVNSLADAVEHYTDPPLLLKRPLPCSPPAYSNQGNASEDVALKLVKSKIAWKKQKKRWVQIGRTSFRGKDKVTLISERLNKGRFNSITKMPYLLTALSQHYDNDPDEYFKGIYNWYFGNSIAVYAIENDSHLFSAGGDELNELYVSSYSRKKSDIAPTISVDLRLSVAGSGPIYDIIALPSEGNVGVRQRNSCSFLSFIDEEDSIRLSNTSAIRSTKFPFVGMDMCGGEICTVNSNREVNFWDIIVDRHPSQEFKLPDPNGFLPDCFARIKYCSKDSPNNYLIIDRKNVYLKDKRSNSCKACISWIPENVCEMCEHISLAVPSTVDNYAYIGLTHTCLLLDLRAGFCQKWTHMLPQTPSVGCVLNKNKEGREPNELLLLATQYTNDAVAIYNKWYSETMPKSSCMPVLVPSRVNTFHEARMNGVFSDPSFNSKFNNSLIGLTAYKRKNRAGIFSLASTGDLFHQCAETLRHKRWELEANRLYDEEIIYLEKWEERFLNLRKNASKQIVTHLTDFSVIDKCIQQCSASAPPENSAPPSRYRHGPASWKKSKKVLQSYADLLGPCIMHDFGMDEESEWGTDDDGDVEGQPMQITAGTMGKVEVWLTDTNPFNTRTERDDQDIDELLRDEQQLSDVEIKLEPDTIDIEISDLSDAESVYSRISSVLRKES